MLCNKIKLEFEFNEWKGMEKYDIISTPKYIFYYRSITYNML